MRRIAATLVLAWLLPPGAAGAKHFFNDFCTDPGTGERIIDTTTLPADPRSLATHDNGYTSGWQDCHGALPAGYAQPDGTPVTRPKTCGEWWQYADEGKTILETRSLLGSTGGGSARTYSDLWKAWGLDSPPDRETFDRVVVERYGFQPAPFDNPYPYAYDTDATCDRVAHPGGCGQLPMGLVQTRDANDAYTGNVGITCLFCHSGRLGTGPGIVGLGNNTSDAELYSQDNVKAGGAPIPLPYPHNTTRGTINAVSDFELLMIVRDFDTLDLSPFVKTLPAHAYPGDQDPPNWWNTGMRPRVYMDGGVAADNTRAIMMFLTAALNENGEWIRNQEQLFEKIETYVQSIEPPPFPASAAPCDPAADPRCIDPAKAAEGKVLFHEKSLFGANPPIAGTNGSCAGCHGVYDPAWAKPVSMGGALPEATGVNVDPADWPRLVGIAGQIVPRDVVATDPGRVDALSPELRWGWGTTWFGMPDVVPGYTAPEAKDPMTEALDDYLYSAELNEGAGAAGLPPRVQGACNWEQEHIGYAAPPLHGIWASAPYFHNGSAPTVWGVLSPAERPRFWRRKLAPGVDLPTGETERGYSTSLSDYDFARLGWQVEEPGCGIIEGIDCSDLEPLNLVLEMALRLPGSLVWNTVQWPPPQTRADVERRKIYDTRLYGKSNRGHEFTAVLDDSERQAIIEYLKTL